MAKPNSLGLGFDLLESRCLLNAAMFALSPLGQGPPDTIGEIVEHANIASPAACLPYGGEAAPAREVLVFHGQVPKFVQGLSSPQTLLITSGDVAPRIIPVVMEESIPPQVTIILYSEYPAQPPRYVPPVVEGSVPPQVTDNGVAEHYGQQTQQAPQTSNVEVDSSGERSHPSPAQRPREKLPVNCTSKTPLHF